MEHAQWRRAPLRNSPCAAGIPQGRWSKEQKLIARSERDGKPRGRASEPAKEFIACVFLVGVGGWSH
jgi:hypothetical protein